MVRTRRRSGVGSAHRAPADYPGDKAGDGLPVEFTVAGVPRIGINGRPRLKHSGVALPADAAPRDPWAEGLRRA